MSTLYDLVRKARRETGAWTDLDLAKLIGSSRRTVQRHSWEGGLSSEAHYQILIQAVHPKNPALAAQLAAARGTSLEALGIAVPAPPSDPTRREHADSVVCAAADVLQLPPSAIRPAIAAAFARAGELEVTFAGLVRHLSDENAALKRKAKTAGSP
jgi:hypothetical protein